MSASFPSNPALRVVDHAVDSRVEGDSPTLDLGLVVPAAIAAAWGLRRALPWADKAAYAVIGWFTLEPISVFAVSIVMLLRDDVNASAVSAGIFAVIAIGSRVVARYLYRPLLSRGRN